MKAIQIKYIPATTTRGARIKAFTDAGSVIEPIEEDQARQVAFRYLVQCNWEDSVSITGFGQLPNGDYVATLGSK